MSLTHRTPRPLFRDAGGYRDDRLFIIACDDTYAPKQYFDFFRIPRVQVHIVATTDGSSAAEHVLNRLLEVDHEEDDERWLLLDTDHYILDNHIGSFARALQKARQAGVRIALSRPCFEFWLLLHHIKSGDAAGLANASEVELKLKEVLGAYNKRRLLAEHYTLRGVVHACQEAKALDTPTAQSDRPETNTSRVYKIWESIIRSASPAQCPEILRDLKSSLS